MTGSQLTLDLLGHLAEVAREIRASPHLFLGLDFDGTLAPIVANPADARIPDDTRRILRQLTARPQTTVAVLSGRAMPDLAARVGMNLILAANHGLEIEGAGMSFRLAEAEDSRDALELICQQIAGKTARIRGTLVEAKGLTASVHYRNADAACCEEIRNIVQEAIASSDDRFQMRGGNKVFEILPRVGWNKGSAVLWILERLPAGAAVCYMGDDETDEDAFEAVGGITVRVGTAMSTAARFEVADTVDAASFLRWLVSAPL